MPSKCIEPNCTKIPNFNISTETKGIYCADHKKENMIDVKHSKCIEPNCTKRPNFNIPTEIKGIYCAKHKKENMIDIKHSRCIEPNCTKQPILFAIITYNITYNIFRY